MAQFGLTTKTWRAFRRRHENASRLARSIQVGSNGVSPRLALGRFACGAEHGDWGGHRDTEFDFGDGFRERTIDCTMRKPISKIFSVSPNSPFPPCCAPQAFRRPQSAALVFCESEEGGEVLRFEAVRSVVGCRSNPRQDPLPPQLNCCFRAFGSAAKCGIICARRG